MFDFDDLEGEEEDRTPKPLALLEADAQDAQYATGWATGRLLRHAPPDVARAVAHLGPAAVVLPLRGRVLGLASGAGCLAYGAHAEEEEQGAEPSASGSPGSLRARFGRLDPAALLAELAAEEAAFESRLRGLSDAALEAEVRDFQDWKARATGRMKTLEQRAAWAFLGIPMGMADQAALRRAFKRKALELHPDKGGDTARFQLLQEMKDRLIIPVSRAVDRSPDEGAGYDAAGGGPNNSEDFFGGDEEEDRAFREAFRGEEREAWAWSEKQDEEEADLVPVGEAFDRVQQEASRRKLRQNVLQLWEKCGRLAAELRREPMQGCAAEVLRPLRGVLDRFTRTELGGLLPGDAGGARALLQRLLNEDSETLCAAGALDPAAAVSAVTVQLCLPLLAAAPSPELQRLCAGLADAIRLLPRTFEDFVRPVLGPTSFVQPAAPEEAVPAPPDQARERPLPRQPDSLGEPEVEEEPRESGRREEEEPEAEAEDRGDVAEPEASEVTALAARPEEEGYLRLASWDARWDNPCVGERRHDGTAVYCTPCAKWIALRVPFDHLEYECHCKGQLHSKNTKRFMERLWGTLCGGDSEDSEGVEA